MLPPAHLRHSLLLTRSQPLVSHALRASATAVLRTGLASHQPRRTFWGWRRHADWTSHLDPLYHRFCRVRTLKTRAKLLRKLQRRGKFEWEGHGADFFTPKHVRWATRWDGPGGRRPWWIYPVNENHGKDVSGREVGKEKGKEGEGEEDGFELSPREKIWKDKMERMRKRIESDPYEAIFGKRFEPFWSPLVPSWMREEMGLPVWTVKSSTEPVESSTKSKVEPKKDEVKKPEPVPSTEVPKTTPTPKKTEDKAPAAPKIETEPPKPASYAYASSTSWDSWSNKTRRVEWDSVSGQTKKYEYDPISNRMVPVESSKPAEAKSIEGAPEAEKKSEVKKDDGAINIPVKQSSELRKSIPIPPPLSQPSHSIPIGFSTTTTTTSVGPLKSTAVASDAPKSTAVAADKPISSAVAKVAETAKAEEPVKQKEEGLESLTADDVRANMGKPRTPAAEQKKTDQTKSSVRTQVDALLSERHISNTIIPIRSKLGSSAPAKESEWDKANLNVLYDRELESLYKKKEKLLKDERGLFHIERQKRELMKLDTRIKELTARLEKLTESGPKATPIPAQEKTTTGLQPSLDRMQSKSTPQPAVQNEDADDSAAHESTEPVESANTTSNVPRDWANQADLLQAARVRRSVLARGLYPNASKSASSVAASSAVTPAEISARKKANEARRAADEAKAAAEAELRKKEKAARRAEDEAKAAEEVAKIKAEKTRREREQKLEKANAMLEAEVKEQKFRMQAHENRYAHKIRALRGELEIAYKQSAVHGEKHLERIRNLEAELEKAQKAVGEKAQVGVEGSQAEGDLAAGVTNWYQQQLSSRTNDAKASKAWEQRQRDRDLVQEIRNIYESRYGSISAEHRQAQAEKDAASKPKVVEVESDVDLGEALAKYEKEHDVVYNVKPLKQVLEKELQAKEREANEGIKLVDDTMPRLIPTAMAKGSTADVSEPTDVQWAIPPVYKVLAYDSGNDMMSTATTTSNFTGSETPISISEALSQLYAPARFVGAFADLQKEGYQVIYGTKDLLVFRKVSEPSAASVEQATPALEDHGLVVGENHPDHWKDWNLARLHSKTLNTLARIQNELSSTNVNPIDGTPRMQPDHQVEPIVKPAQQSKPDNATPAKSLLPDESHNVFDTETDWRHYPRVKREEYPVFTGTRRKWRHSRRSDDATGSQHKFGKSERRERSRRRRAVWRTAIGTGIVGAGVAYFVGAAAEKSRKGDSGKGGSGDEWVMKVEKAEKEKEKEKEKEVSKWMWR